MDYSNYYRQDDIDLKSIEDRIEIWQATALMDGGTIFLHCRYKDKLFQIVSTQFTGIGQDEIPEYLHLNAETIPIQSEEEKIILQLIRESVNAGDAFRFLPKFIVSLPWFKKTNAYWVKIFKKEILDFVGSKKYFQFAQKQIESSKKENEDLPKGSRLSEKIKSMGVYPD